MGKEGVIATHTGTRTRAASSAVAATEVPHVGVSTALGGRAGGVAIALVVRWERTVPSDEEAIHSQSREPALVCSVQVRGAWVGSAYEIT